MDFEDVSQIIKIHIYRKWDLYDPSKPIGPWLNRIISNQLKNLIRNNYGNFSKPCLKCAAAEEDDSCKLYNKQCKKCPLFFYWESNKKSAHNLKIPVSLDHHIHELDSLSYNDENFRSNTQKLHHVMKTKLKSLEWKIYEMLYIQELSDEEVAEKMNYTTSEKNRPKGYKQLKNIKKSIIAKVKKVLQKGEVDII